MRSGFLHLRYAAVVWLALSTPIALNAALITFRDRAAFDAATTVRTDTGFEGVVPSNSVQNFPNPTGLTVSGFTFKTSGTGPFGPGFVTVYGAEVAAQQSPVLNTGTGAILVWGPPNQPGTAYLDVLLPPGNTTFAADVWAQQPFEATVSAVVNSGEATANFDFGTVNRPTPHFFGVASDGNTIILVRFGIPAGQVGLVLDNVSAGTVRDDTAVIPEPGTIALLLGGLAGAAVVRRLAPSRQ